MNVASIDRCKKLYELSQWGDTDQNWFNFADEWVIKPSDYERYEGIDYPAYDLGYLLRKLPSRFPALEENKLIFDKSEGSDIYFWWYGADHQTVVPGLVGRAKTPEDALTTLAIELLIFKQGVL